MVPTKFEIYKNSDCIFLNRVYNRQTRALHTMQIPHLNSQKGVTVVFVVWRPPDFGQGFILVIYGFMV